ncbi:Uncharacterised protein [Acidipropionibacterium jensenii]|uniref:Uncharacterized protein n=1 Tax=Acidipropionibacterium jensenii TaxID=1749 RepID=A0A448P1T0_9ACTN|nr:Uncharacterised protein [Acidipropionibacterium jensenii]
MGGMLIIWLLLVGLTIWNFLIERHAERSRR